MIIGRYVKTFAEADMGILKKTSLNAPYKFHWVYLKSVEADHIVCEGGREEMRLPLKRRGDREFSEVTVKDPIFGPLKFKVAPFKRDSR